MVDIFSIIIIVVGIGFVGGLIYLIYRPFKKQLKDSGKLTDKLSRQINRTFILLLCFVSIVLYCFKDYRTPSIDRLEDTIIIKLPSDYRVLKDEYNDMAPMSHFQVLYEIKFGDKSSKEIIKLITTSPFYNSKIKAGDELFDSSAIQVEDVRAIWCKTTTGYRFRRLDLDKMYYNVTYDTLTKVLSYDESSD